CCHADRERGHRAPVVVTGFPDDRAVAVDLPVCLAALPDHLVVVALFFPAVHLFVAARTFDPFAAPTFRALTTALVAALPLHQLHHPRSRPHPVSAATPAPRAVTAHPLLALSRAFSRRCWAWRIFSRLVSGRVVPRPISRS